MGVFIKLAPFVNYLKRLSHPPHTWVPLISSENLSSPHYSHFWENFIPPFMKGGGWDHGQPASLRKKLFHTSSIMYLALIFWECITITSFEEGLKVCEHNFFQWKVVLFVIYLFNHNLSKSTIFTLNMEFDVLLSAVFVK